MVEPSPSSIRSVPCHLGGATRLVFSQDGSTIFTGGSDCLVRIHKADDPDSEPGFHDDHEDAVTSLSCSKSHLVTSSLDNIARVYSYPQNELQGFVTRSSGVPIRWVSIDRQGDRVAVCSDDLLVKIINVHDTNKVSHLSDNTKSVRSASWDPSGKYLTTAGCDGKLRVYDTTGDSPILLKIMEGVIGSSDSDSATSCYAAWHPAGNYFVAPTRTNDIGIIHREGWSKGTTFSQDGHRSPVGELAWSPNGRYLASAAGAQILIWSNETRQVVAKYTNPEGNITGLAFSPISNLLAFTSYDGSFVRWTDPIPSSLPSPVASEAAQAKTIERLLDDEFGMDDDVDIEERGEDIVDEMADDWIVDDEGDYGADDDERKWRAGRTEVVNVTRAQPAFTPGSTSMRSKKRYLAFNMIGVVDVTDLETHNVINVEFHDKSARRGYHFQDHNKFTMASLGEQGIVYASAAEGDEASIISYRPYDSWASQAEWLISLSPGENAVLVAAGGCASRQSIGSVVIATSKGLVRFLSGSGIQRYVWRLGDEVVSMAAGKDAVIIAHREGGTTLDGCQNLRYTVIDLETYDLIQEGRIPLPKKVIITWIGFTSQGSPAIFDSTGLLSVLDRYRHAGQARWAPLLDTSTLARRAGKTENYWPVGLTGTHLSCVILKGSEKEPWFPRPLIQELDVQMPLLSLDSAQGKLEESVMRGEIQLGQLRDELEDRADADIEFDIKAKEVALDKELLQLVQGACKADNLQRALDLTRLMHAPNNIDAASKIAAFYHLPGLQERIMGVKASKEKKRREGERRKARVSDFGATSNGGGRNGGTPAASSKQFNDFAPRDKPRRSFGGVTRDRERERDLATPHSTIPNPTARSETFIPETPRDESTPFTYDLEETPAPPSPEIKRKREDEENFAPIPIKRSLGETTATATSAAAAAKNPFAKKQLGSNPFAKPASAKPLDAIKSTSFFERVDNIESSSTAKAKSRPAAKKDKASGGSTLPSGKQQTLLNLKTAPKLVPQDSLAPTEADDGETQQEEEETVSSDAPVRILEDSQVQDTVMSPEPESMEVS